MCEFYISNAHDYIAKFIGCKFTTPRRNLQQFLQKLGKIIFFNVTINNWHLRVKNLTVKGNLFRHKPI